jgi:hypothetical protein
MLVICFPAFNVEEDLQVPEPVGRSSKGHARTTVLRGIQLGDHSPDQGTPGCRKGGDEKTREGNENGTGGRG